MVSELSSARIGEIISQKVEAILAAADTTAARLREEAAAEVADRRQALEREVDRQRADARRDAAKAIEDARREATKAIEDARREAGKAIEDARREAREMKARAAQEGDAQLARAQAAANEAAAEAKAVSSGLKQLGYSLTDQAERILRDVQAAHKRLTADLRVAGSGSSAIAPERTRPGGRESGTGGRGTRKRAETSRARPAEDIDVPPWLEPDS